MSAFPHLELFDVSLRDGLQDMERIYSLDSKIDLFDQIISKSGHMICDYEIGSFASSRRVPQMNQSDELYTYLVKKYPRKNFYLLIFGTPGFTRASALTPFPHLSFITSYCETFIQKNINRTCEESIAFIESSFHQIDHLNHYRDPDHLIKTKVYISAFCGSPHTPYDFAKLKSIIHRLAKSASLISLSDTYGLLTPSLCVQILEDIKGSKIIMLSDLSFHIHKNAHFREIIQIVRSYGIYKFDVSHIEGGGCVIIEKSNPTSLQNLHIRDLDLD